MEVSEALEVSEVLEVLEKSEVLGELEAMRCGGYALFMEVPEVSEVPEVIRCALLLCWKPWRVGSVRWRCCEVP